MLHDAYSLKMHLKVAMTRTGELFSLKVHKSHFQNCPVSKIWSVRRRPLRQFVREMPGCSSAVHRWWWRWLVKNFHTSCKFLSSQGISDDRRRRPSRDWPRPCVHIGSWAFNGGQSDIADWVLSPPLKALAVIRIDVFKTNRSRKKIVQNEISCQRNNDVILGTQAPYTEHGVQHRTTQVGLNWVCYDLATIVIRGMPRNLNFIQSVGKQSRVMSVCYIFAAAVSLINIHDW